MTLSLKRWKGLVSIAGRYDTVMVVSQWCCAEGATMPVKAVLKLFCKSKNSAFKGLLSLIILQSICKTLVLPIQIFRLSICPLSAATQPGSQHIIKQTSHALHHQWCLGCKWEGDVCWCQWGLEVLQHSWRRWSLQLWMAAGRGS